MFSNDVFDYFGLDRRTATPADLKRAYAARLKATRPEDDPQGFMQLRQSLEQALREIQWRDQYGDEHDFDDDQRDDPSLNDPEAEPSDITPAAQKPAASIRTSDQSSGEESDEAEQAFRSEFSLTHHPSLTERTHKAFDPPAEEIEESRDRDPALAGRTHPTLSQALFDAAPDDAVDEAMDAIIDTLTGPWGASSTARLSRVIESQDVSGIDEYQELSARLRWFLCDRTGLFLEPEPATPLIPDWMTGEVLDLFETHFGWTRQATTDQWEHRQNGWIGRLIHMRAESKKSGGSPAWPAGKPVRKTPGSPFAKAGDENAFDVPSTKSEPNRGLIIACIVIAIAVIRILFAMID
jgi:hypothetical protein